MIEKYVQSGIIEAAELKALLDAGAKIKVVDATFSLPGAAQSPYQDYLKQRIDDAVFFDIEAISDQHSPLPHMLPPPDYFASAVSKLGISNDDFIVVYGQTGMVMGPARIWWTFRAFGHDAVCVLNGGLPAWLKAGLPVVRDLPGKVALGSFIPAFRAELVRGIDEVQEASAGQSALILDARPEGRFTGESPEPRQGMRSGHIPGSRNVPCMNLVSHETGKLKSRQELQQAFDSVGLQEGMPVITSCGSGVTACMIALALYHIGYESVPVYDGSWAEWGQQTAPTGIATGRE
jgi:thiosulfate/3-mercaptopyruvate sulfurtransferase